MRRGSSCLCAARASTRAAASRRRFERHGRGASSALLRTPKPGVAGGYSGWSGFFRALNESRRIAPAVARSDAGRCLIHRQEAPEIGDAGRAFPADGAEGPHARGASRHVRARKGKNVTGLLRWKSGDANTAPVPPRPSERETRRVVCEETHFLPMMPRLFAGEPVLTTRHGVRWRPPPAGSFR
jgi:hypothetical protein